jgi:Zn finger protein HypA/HybF involved in hydrogenase expression
MAIYKDEEIIALRVGETRQVLCRDCSTAQQWSDTKEDDIITQESVDKKDFVYFCDTCKKRLQVGTDKSSLAQPSRLVSSKTRQ